MGFRDPTPEELAELNGTPALRDPTPEELAELEAPPSGAGPWRAGLVAHEGMPYSDSDISTTPTPLLGPTPVANDISSTPEKDIAGARKALDDSSLPSQFANEAGREAGEMGAAIKNVAHGVAAIPGQIVREPARAWHDPLGAARAAKSGLVDAATIGLLSPQQELVDAHQNYLAAHSTAAAMLEKDPSDSTATNLLQEAANRLQVAQANVEAMQGHPGAAVLGAAAAPVGLGKAVGSRVATGLGPASGVVGRIANTTTAGVAGGAAEGSARALLAGENPGTGAVAGAAGGALTALPLAAGAEAGSALVGKVVGGAPERVDARLLRALGKGATPEEQAALLEQKPAVLAAMREDGLKGAPAARIAEVRKGYTAEKEANFAAAERPSDADALITSLKARRDQLAANPAPESQAQAKKLSGFIDNVAERWAKPTEPQAPAEPPEPPPIQKPRELTDAEAVKQFAAEAGKAARNEASGRLDDMTAVVKDFGLRQHINDPVGMKAAVDAGVDIAGRKLGNVDKVITEAGGGLPITSAMRGLDKVVQKYEGDPVAKDVAGRIGQVVENVRDAWRDKFPVVNQVTRVPLAEVRRMSSQIAESAFATDPTMPPKLATRIRRELYGALRDAMTEHIDEVAKANGLQDQVGDYAKLNRDYAALRTMKKLTDPQAAAAIMAPPVVEPPQPTITSRDIPKPPPVPKSGKVKLSDMRMTAESFEPGSPERTVLEQAIADRVSEAPADIGAAISALSKREGALKAIEGPAVRRETAAAFAEPKKVSESAQAFGTTLRAAQTIGRAAAPVADQLMAAKLPKWVPLVGGKSTSQLADAAMANLALAVHSGRVTPGVVSEAMKAGVPSSVVRSVLDRGGVKGLDVPEQP